MENGSTTTILVVEDNADDQFLLCRQLEKAQLDDHAIFIDDGKKALDFLLEAEHPPLAVFIDLRLPHVSGIEIIEEMKKVPRLEKVPVIVMTGSNNPRDLETCTKLGVTAFLPKPVELVTFIKTVAHIFPKVGEEA